ncbi:Uncharacterised protein [Escherichia coli]|nr:Uncharacterised protein [Escherichia coli]
MHKSDARSILSVLNTEQAKKRTFLPLIHAQKFFSCTERFKISTQIDFPRHLQSYFSIYGEKR